MNKIIVPLEEWLQTLRYDEEVIVSYSIRPDQMLEEECHEVQKVRGVWCGECEQYIKIAFDIFDLSNGDATREVLSEHYKGHRATPGEGQE